MNEICNQEFMYRSSLLTITGTRRATLEIAVRFGSASKGTQRESTFISFPFRLICIVKEKLGETNKHTREGDRVRKTLLFPSYHKIYMTNLLPKMLDHISSITDFIPLYPMADWARVGPMIEWKEGRVCTRRS